MFLQAESAGLPPPVEGPDDTEQKLKTQQNALAAVHSDEVAGLAKADMDIGHQQSDDLRNKMSTNMTDQIVSNGLSCFFPPFPPSFFSSSSCSHHFFSYSSCVHNNLTKGYFFNMRTGFKSSL